jgi:hypothetical protein
MQSRAWHRRAKVLHPSVALVIIGALSWSAVAQSPAAATSLYGSGANYCAHAPEGASGFNLDSSMQTPGGVVVACGPVPVVVNPVLDTGPEIKTFWPVSDSGGFQCTELAIRYFYVATDGKDFVNENASVQYGEKTQHYWDGTGKDFAAEVAAHFGFAVSSHSNGRSSSTMPRIGDILSEMTSPGETYAEANKIAGEVGDVGIVKAVIPATATKPASIELMVENNESSGLNDITIHSATSWSINGSDSFFYYTSFKWFSPVSSAHPGSVPSPPVHPIVSSSPPAHAINMPSSPFQYNIYGTVSPGEYAAPSATSKQVGVLPIGNEVDLRCQEAGSVVKGSAVWDQLTNGEWVSDYFVDTPNIGDFSYPIPICITSKYLIDAVHNTGSVVVRGGPSTGDPSVRTVDRGATVEAVCQTSGTLVGTSRTWDYLTNLGYVPTFYLTIVKGTNSLTLPQCPNVTPASKIPPTTTTTTTTSTSGALTFTAADGFKFGVKAGAPKIVTEYVNSGQHDVAPPGQDYVKISVSVKSLQNDRAAPLFDLVDGGGGGGYAVFMGEPASDASKSNGWCASFTGVYTAPSAYCADTEFDTLLPDGEDVQTAVNLGEDPIVKAGKTVTINTFFGPVPTGSSLSGFALLFGIGDGPKMFVLHFG